MTVITITRSAKCKDCGWLLPKYIGKRKRHICSNTESKYFGELVRLNDLVCENWKL